MQRGSTSDEKSKKGVGLDDPFCIEGMHDAEYFKRVHREYENSGDRASIVKRSIDGVKRGDWMQECAGDIIDENLTEERLNSWSCEGRTMPLR